MKRILISLFVISSCSMMVGCSNTSSGYDTNTFLSIRNNPRNPDGANFAKPVMDFLKDLSKNRIEQKKKKAILDIVTEIRFEKPTLDNEEASVVILRFTKNDPIILEAEILRNLQKLEENPFPLFNRYYFELQGKLFYDGEFKRDIDIKCGLFQGFTFCVGIGKIKDTNGKVEFEGVVYVRDSKDGKKTIYSRAIKRKQDKP